MNYRPFGNTGWQVSEISLGTWQVGGRWGTDFDEELAIRILNEAIDRGVNVIDTADVYSDGLSEKVVGKVVKSRSETIYVASKSGRRFNPHVASAYTPESIASSIEDSLRNTGLDTIDLIQLHCPPTAVYDNQEIFSKLDDLVKEGKIRNYGVSVEKVSEALTALQYPGLASVQIIVNMFRHKPIELFFPELADKRIGVLARVPLASGLLSGKMSQKTTFDAGDHRQFNRNGEAFDKGETFSGVDFEAGIKAANELQVKLGTGEKLYAYALRWLLMFPEISCVIPGASRPEQVISNLEAASLNAFSDGEMEIVRSIYDKYFRSEVHPQW